MISAFANAFRIPELKKRILFTLMIVVITRLGAAIPVPGVDASARQQLCQLPAAGMDTQRFKSV